MSSTPWSPATVGGSEGPWTSHIGDDGPLEGEFSPSVPSVLMGNALSPGPGEAPAACLPLEIDGKTVTADNALAPTIQRLVSENATLREAFDDANKRLSKLEEEKQRFMDEGVFDLVNSVCGHTGGSTTGGGCSQPRPDTWIVEPAMDVSPRQLELSPNSELAAKIRRSAEERRSIELSDENEELRRELARASELGESLEQQQQAAEDRMHSLEQERAWLAERFRLLAETGADIVEAESGGIPGPALVRLRSDAGTVESEMRKQLEEANAKLQEELQDAARREEELRSGKKALEAANGEALERQRQLELQAQEQRLELERLAQERQLELEREAHEGRQQLELEAHERWQQLELAEERHRSFEEAALERQRQLESAAQAERAQLQDRDRIISSLDVQTQDLERRLRETEARAGRLAEENSRLQLALDSLPQGSAALEALRAAVESSGAPSDPQASDAESGLQAQDAGGLVPLEFDLDEAF